METSKGEDDNDVYEDDRSENGDVDLLPDLSKVETPQPRLHTKPQLTILVTCQNMNTVSYNVTISEAIIMKIVVPLIITIMMMMSTCHGLIIISS